MTHATTAQQGHRYQYGHKEVFAMESGVAITVREIDETEAYPLGAPIVVKASWLTPLPMRYFQGEIPA